MATMPSTGDYYTTSGAATHEVLVPELDISMLNSTLGPWSEEEQWLHQYGSHHHHHHPQAHHPVGFFKQEPCSVPTKTEPIPEHLDYFENNWQWQQNGQVQHLHMNAMAYQQDGSPNNQLQLSDPPTPAAECQVTSTNLSPLYSPNSPPSDAGSLYDGAHGESFLTGEPSHFDTTDLNEINIKGLTEEQLVSLTARDLNRICREMPEDIVKQLKKRRRTLKNRGYAYNSRVRRVSQKTALETERDDLRAQIKKLTDRCMFLEKEADQWKKKATTLERGHL